MGLVDKKGSFKEYWSEYWLTQTPAFGKHMPRDMYCQILRYLHFVDNEALPTDRNDPNFDKLQKIKPVIDVVVRKFREVYTPERQLALDETMIKFKGRLGIKQYIKNKPNRKDTKYIC